MKYIVAALLAVALSACGNLAGKSAEYQAEHQRVFWEKLNGGDAQGGAQAWANLHAHEAAERKVGK